MIRVDPMYNEVILTFAWFAVVNAIISIATMIAARFFADGVGADPRRARLLALTRLAPAATATIAAVGIFLPAHSRLEPPRADEWLGPWTLTVGMCGIALVLRSAFRLAAAWHRIGAARRAIGTERHAGAASARPKCRSCQASRSPASSVRAS